MRRRKSVRPRFIRAARKAGRLEVEAQRELHGSGVGGAGNLAERRAGIRRGNRRVAEVVGHVEELRAERRIHAFGDAEVLLKRHVPVVEERVGDGIRAEVAERAGGGNGERRRQHVLGSGCAVPVADDVRTLVGDAGAGDVAGHGDVERQAGLQRGYAGDLPSAEAHLVPFTTRLPERQRVDVAGDEDVVAIVVRRAPVAAEVVAVHRLVVVGVGIGTGFRPGVGDVEQAAAGELLLELELGRVVDEVGAGHVLVDRRIAGIRAQRVGVGAGVGLEGAGLELVHVLLVGQVGGTGPDIRQVNGHVLAHLLLDAEAPVERTGDLHVEIVRVVDGGRECLQRGAGRILDIAVVDGGLLDERRVVDGAEDEVAFDAFVEHTEAAADHGALLAGDVIGKADARSPGGVVGVGRAFGQVAEQRQHRFVFGYRHAALAASGNPEPPRTRPL